VSQDGIEAADPHPSPDHRQPTLGRQSSARTTDMTAALHAPYTPKVSVRLTRFEGREEILVTVIGDPADEDPAYFNKLEFSEEHVGFVLDPNHPHEIEIEDDIGVYGGSFEPLSQSTGAFLARPPRALIDLLFPSGATSVTLPCQAKSGDHDLRFILPQ